MKKLILAMFIVCAATSNAYAYRFQDYVWGTPMSKVDASLKKLNEDEGIEYYTKKDVKVSDATIYYTDSVFGGQCEIFLEFTPRTKLLAKIYIKYPTAFMGLKVLEALKGENGLPNFSSKYKMDYAWGYVNADERITLNFGNERIDVVYTGGEFWRKYKAEQAEMASTKVKK